MIDQNKLAGVLGSQIAGTATECMGVVAVELTDTAPEFMLTENELKVCRELPDILVSLADFHDSKASMAAAMGYRESTDHHSARAEELKAEARRIESTW